MTLSCGCDYDADGAEWYYDSNGVFLALDTKRARRCCVCKTPVRSGAGSMRTSR